MKPTDAESCPEAHNELMYCDEIGLRLKTCSMMRGTIKRVPCEQCPPRTHLYSTVIRHVCEQEQPVQNLREKHYSRYREWKVASFYRSSLTVTIPGVSLNDDVLDPLPSSRIHRQAIPTFATFNPCKTLGSRSCRFLLGMS
jgi:hypothetical protein